MGFCLAKPKMWANSGGVKITNWERTGKANIYEMTLRRDGNAANVIFCKQIIGDLSLG